MLPNHLLQILRIYLKDCAVFIRSRVEKIESDCSDVCLLGDQDFESYMGHFEQELSSVETESAKVSDEIEGLVRTHEEDFNRLNVDIGQLKCSLDFVGSQVGFLLINHWIKYGISLFGGNISNASLFDLLETWVLETKHWFSWLHLSLIGFPHEAQSYIWVVFCAHVPEMGRNTRYILLLDMFSFINLIVPLMRD